MSLLLGDGSREESGIVCDQWGALSWFWYPSGHSASLACMGTLLCTQKPGNQALIPRRSMSEQSTSLLTRLELMLSRLLVPRSKDGEGSGQASSSAFCTY